MKTKLFIAGLLFLIGAVACQPLPEVEIEPEPNQPAVPTQEPTESPILPVSQRDKMVQLAIADLSQQLNLDPELVAVVDAHPVVWPDTSLGCPQEGMMYAQVETNGFIVNLKADGNLYLYHTDATENIVLCETPQFPVILITPGDIDDGQPWVPVE